MPWSFYERGLGIALSIGGVVFWVIVLLHS